MADRDEVIKALECISNCAKQPCRDCEYSKREEWCIAECAKDALALLKAREPPTNTSITSAIECLLHPQDADDIDMAKAIDTAVHAMRFLKEQEPIEAQLHLCESCIKKYPDCNANYIEFGCGRGKDNVIGCDAYINRWVADHDCQRDYEAATEMTEYCERYEPIYNPEDGSL